MANFAVDLGTALFSGDSRAGLIAALLKNVPGILASEVAAKNDSEGTRRRSDLYYLLKVEQQSKR